MHMGIPQNTHGLPSILHVYCNGGNRDSGSRGVGGGREKVRFKLLWKG
jgi:hypothetical protein